MGGIEESGSQRLLDPVDRISEVLFGLVMAVTIVGSLSVATAGRAEVRTVMIGALGCNLAWGMVDAVMYLVRILTARSRHRALAGRVADVDPEAGRRMIAGELPQGVAVLCGPDEIEAMRRNLLAGGGPSPALLERDDVLAALGIFLLVVLATFPVVVPFMLLDDATRAMQASRVVTVLMLFLAGFGLGRYGGHGRPVLAGALAAMLGVVVIVAVMALGG